MKLGTVLIAALVVVGTLAAAVWIGKYGGLSADLKNTQAASGPTYQEPPDIADDGPQPKVFVEEPEYDFGVMTVGQTRTHTFMVRNEGDAPLKLALKGTSCKCTIGELEHGAVPPGGSTEVTLEWTPESADDQFRQLAQIWTNDPEFSEASGTPLELYVSGQVKNVILMQPEGLLELGELSGTGPTRGEFMMYSPVREEFQIVNIESSNELMATDVQPMTEEELKAVPAESGYKVAVTIQPGAKPGGFEEQLTIHTDQKDANLFTLDVGAVQLGPVRILAGQGVRWNPRPLLLHLGRIRAAEGETAVLTMIYSGMGDETLEIEDVRVDSEHVRVSLEPHPDLQPASGKAFVLTVEVPAGGPPVSYVQPDTVEATILSNHPLAGEFTFQIQFVAY